MTSISLPFTDAFLRLSLPFPGLSPALRLALALLGLTLFLGLFIALYRYEMRLIRRRFALALLGLRIAAFVVLFLLLALEPVLARSIIEEVPGKVLVAIDRSDSMKVTDPSRPLAEKLRIAKALKLVPDLATDGQLEAWAKDCDTGGLPRFGLIGGDGESQRFDAVVKRMDELSRLELCSRILTKDGLGLVDALREKHQLELIGFGKDVAALPIGADRLKDALAGAKKDGVTLYTDLKLPLAHASETSATDTGAKLLGVVLLTDGRHNWGESPALRARELGERKVPVHSIAIAPKDPPTDIAVVTAQAQAATVFKGSMVPIEVGVRINGWPAGPVKVTLDFPADAQGNRKPQLEETIEHDGRDAVYPLTFKAKMDDPGPQ
ncbi:MAG: VWA domain-containing protein, partial [Planctomycetia bacterium]|nr:VWA domain-containing protein [Planctomycetia bacterium]